MNQHSTSTVHASQRARWRRRAAFAAGAASVALLVLPAAPAFAATGAHWRTRATEIAPPTDSATNPQAEMSGLACTSNGFCVAGGQYDQASGNAQAMVATQTHGRWARMQTLALPGNAAADPYGDVMGVACASRGNCVAVGSYDTAPTIALPMAAAESRGKWAPAAALRLPANAAPKDQLSYLTSVTCTSGGACEAVGTYTDKSAGVQMMAAYKPARGRWGRLREITPPKGAAKDPSAYLDSLSCTSTGNCVAVGSYYTPSQMKSLAVVQVRGRWRRAVRISTPANGMSGGYTDLTSVSCMHNGTCAIVGLYEVSGVNTSMSLTFARGRFSKATQIKAMPRHAPAKGALQLESVSCAPAGPCEAAGSIDVPGLVGSVPVTVLRTASGKWKQATIIAPPRGIGTAFFTAIACVPGGHCAATGYGKTSAVTVAIAASTR